MKFTTWIIVRMTEDEKSNLPDIAKVRGFDSVSAYIRWLIRNDNN